MSSPIVHLSRRLSHEQTVGSLSGIAVRTFAGEPDISVWLELRTMAFSGETPTVRPWTRTDFAAEFLKRPWWSPERMWFAVADKIVGSVALALRGHEQAAVPVIHWLMVAPECRRRGIGRMLMATAESACWQAGYRRISLETHTGWAAATEFYRVMGYL
jgi:GNAT superfamily N-acetyltransferase